jgi:hypothetical protein
MIQKKVKVVSIEPGKVEDLQNWTVFTPPNSLDIYWVKVGSRLIELKIMLGLEKEAPLQMMIQDILVYSKPISPEIEVGTIVGTLVITEKEVREEPEKKNCTGDCANCSQIGICGVLINIKKE